MPRRTVPLLVLVAALAALAGTIAFAVARAGGGGNHGERSMMGGAGYAMMGADGEAGAWYLNGAEPVSTIASARARAQRFADRLDLRAGTVTQFADNFSVLLTDGQGKPATETLVDPGTGAVTLEYGPAMMWNTRYGMMSGAGEAGPSGMMDAAGGMMGRYGGGPSWTPSTGGVSGPIGVAEATRLANAWLGRQGDGQSAADPVALPGYFTFRTLKGGKIASMLSVDERTGAVWYHWWHGRFVATEE